VKPEVVSGPGMPRTVGPYSHVTRLGDVLYVSGQPGIDPGSGAVPDGGFDAEARQAFVNLRTVLEAVGSGLDHVAKVTVFLASADYFPQVNALFAEFFPSDPPARSTPVVSLPRGLLISIEAIAGT
jgi:2-iminobutanoate/2-iminopropanoate deaminase